MYRVRADSNLTSRFLRYSSRRLALFFRSREDILTKTTSLVKRGKQNERLEHQWYLHLLNSTCIYTLTFLNNLPGLTRSSSFHLKAACVASGIPLYPQEGWWKCQAGCPAPPHHAPRLWKGTGPAPSPSAPGGGLGLGEDTGGNSQFSSSGP